MARPVARWILVVPLALPGPGVSLHMGEVLAVDVVEAGWQGFAVLELIGHRRCGLVSADSGGAGARGESADVPYAEPAFTGRLGKTVAEPEPAYPERPAPAA